MKNKTISQERVLLGWRFSRIKRAMRRMANRKPAIEKM